MRQASTRLAPFLTAFAAMSVAHARALSTVQPPADTLARALIALLSLSLLLLVSELYRHAINLWRSAGPPGHPEMVGFLVLSSSLLAASIYFSSYTCETGWSGCNMLLYAGRVLDTMLYFASPAIIIWALLLYRRASEISGAGAPV